MKTAPCSKEDNVFLHQDYHYRPVYKNKDGFVDMIEYYSVPTRYTQNLMQSVKLHLKVCFNRFHREIIYCKCPNCECYYRFLQKKKCAPDDALFDEKPKLQIGISL